MCKFGGIKRKKILCEKQEYCIEWIEDVDCIHKADAQAT